VRHFDKQQNDALERHNISLYEDAPTSSSECLVAWTVIDSLVRDLPIGLGLEPQHGQVSVELLGARLGQLVVCVVPACTLHEQTMDVATVRWALFQLLCLLT